MAKGAANEDKLAGLHNALATVIAQQVQETQEIYDEDGNPTGRFFYPATPALLTVAARFLKDNDITCEVEESIGLSELQKALAEKKKHSSSKIRDISFLTEKEANG